MTDGAESDDRPSARPSVGRREREREGGQLQSLRRSNSKLKRRFVRCPKDETAVASSETAGGGKERYSVQFEFILIGQDEA